MIKIYVSGNFSQERKYIIEVIFKEFLGLEYQLEISDNIQDYEITFGNKKLIVRDHFFNQFTYNDYLDQQNIPDQVAYLSNQFIPEQDIPVIYGNDELTVSSDKIICGIDIFASSFFRLSRWEEYVNKTRDQHDRFPATASLAYKNNFLLRPVVNEYVEMLWNMLVALGYKGKRKERKFEVKVSHDVDVPFQYYLRPSWEIVKAGAKGLIKEKSFKKMIANSYSFIRSKFCPEEYDPFYTFETIMDISDQHDLKSAFYFIADHSAGKIDGDYDIFHPRIQRLLKHIDSRGHEIGLHGSYNSYNDKDQYQKEWDRLINSCQQAQVQQLPTGSRQHYLRWSTPESCSIINSAGVAYDTTLSYADYIGFRCGVCYEFPVFDVVNRKSLALVERPLLIMECTLLDKRYMNQSAQEAIDKALKMKQSVSNYNGCFTVLWHNTRFLDIKEINLYKHIVR